MLLPANDWTFDLPLYQGGVLGVLDVHSVAIFSLRRAIACH